MMALTLFSMRFSWVLTEALVAASDAAVAAVRELVTVRAGATSVTVFNCKKIEIQGSNGFDMQIYLPTGPKFPLFSSVDCSFNCQWVFSTIFWQLQANKTLPKF